MITKVKNLEYLTPADVYVYTKMKNDLKSFYPPALPEHNTSRIHWLHGVEPKPYLYNIHCTSIYTTQYMYSIHIVHRTNRVSTWQKINCLIFRFYLTLEVKKKMSSRYTTVTKHQLSKSSIQVGLGVLDRFRIKYPPICKLPTFNATNPWVSRKPMEKAWQPKLARNALN